MYLLFTRSHISRQFTVIKIKSISQKFTWGSYHTIIFPILLQSNSNKATLILLSQICRCLFYLTCYTGRLVIFCLSTIPCRQSISYNRIQLKCLLNKWYIIVYMILCHLFNKFYCYLLVKPRLCDHHKNILCSLLFNIKETLYNWWGTQWPSGEGNCSWSSIIDGGHRGLVIVDFPPGWSNFREA